MRNKFAVLILTVAMLSTSAVYAQTPPEWTPTTTQDTPPNYFETTTRRVGVGTASPGAQLHVTSPSGLNMIAVTNNVAPPAVAWFADSVVGGWYGGVLAMFDGNSAIQIAHLQIGGYSGDPVIFSRNVPLGINNYSGSGDVYIGNTAENNRLIVQTHGPTSFAGDVNVGTSALNASLNVAGAVVNTAANGQQSRWSTGTGTNIDLWGASTPANNFVAFRTTNVANSNQVAEVMRITSDGRLLVGTQTWVGNAKLEVNGDAHVAGTLTATSVVNAVYGQDVAEWVRGDRQLAPGTVVITNPEKTNEVMPSHTAYDTTVAGVVSAQPGIVLGRSGELKATVATSGRVRVRVDARQGAIHVGDLLVTSDEEGTAMKSQPIDVGGRKFHQPGTILGKALEPLEEGVGEILVLLSMG